MINETALPVYQTLPATIKLSFPNTDLFIVIDPVRLPAERVRSKGQATLQPDGLAELPATIRDISLSEIGVLAPDGVCLGTRVQIHTHGHEACGVVRTCQPEAGQFYIGIALDPLDPPAA